MNQEELNANMATVTHQMALLAEAVERASGGGRAELFRRVSRVSRQSFRKDLPSEMRPKKQAVTLRSPRIRSASPSPTASGSPPPTMALPP